MFGELKKILPMKDRFSRLLKSGVKETFSENKRDGRMVLDHVEKLLAGEPVEVRDDTFDNKNLLCVVMAFMVHFTASCRIQFVNADDGDKIKKYVRGGFRTHANGYACRDCGLSGGLEVMKDHLFDCCQPIVVDLTMKCCDNIDVFGLSDYRRHLADNPLCWRKEVLEGLIFFFPKEMMDDFEIPSSIPEYMKKVLDDLGVSFSILYGNNSERGEKVKNVQLAAENELEVYNFDDEDCEEDKKGSSSKTRGI